MLIIQPGIHGPDRAASSISRFLPGCSPGKLQDKRVVVDVSEVIGSLEDIRELCRDGGAQAPAFIGGFRWFGFSHCIDERCTSHGGRRRGGAAAQFDLAHHQSLFPVE